MLTLNIIGCGKVGKTLGFLWVKNTVFTVRHVLNRSLKTAQDAVDFIGEGIPTNAVETLSPADVWMLSTPDNQIQSCCIAISPKLTKGTIVFHCSGSRSSLELKSAKKKGAFTASLHPLKSFADPAKAVTTFQETYCSLEGDAEACTVLEKAMQTLGGNTFSIRPEAKVLYHAASVFASNYLVTLMETALRILREVGIDPETASKIAQSLSQRTLHNIATLGTTEALTGPIARGDVETVSQHIEKLQQWDQETSALYHELVTQTLQIARKQGKVAQKKLQKIESIL